MMPGIAVLRHPALLGRLRMPQGTVFPKSSPESAKNEAEVPTERLKVKSIGNILAGGRTDCGSAEKAG